MLEHMEHRKELRQLEVVRDNRQTGQDTSFLERVDSDACGADRMLEPAIDVQVEHKPCYPYS